MDWVVKSANESGAFLSWKPTCYTSHVRKVSSSERIRSYDLRPYHFASDSVKSSGLAFAFFGNDSRTHIQANNISFGGAKDKQYFNVSQYTAWSDVSYIVFKEFLVIITAEFFFLVN